MNTARAKIRTAREVTDKVVEGWNAAQERLRDLWVDGAGVLSEPSHARADIKAAKAALDKALLALETVREWPNDHDYEAAQR